MPHYQVEMETRICGIPCIVGVATYNQVKGSHDFHAASDVDYWGYEEIEFDVMDRNGRLAPWLERKMTDQDYAKVEKEIKQYFSTN